MAIHVTDILSIDDLPDQCIEECSRPGRAADGPVDYWRRRWPRR